MSEAITIYKKKVQTLEIESNKLKSLLKLIAIWRLVFFTAPIFFLIYSSQLGTFTTITGIVISLVFFVFLIKRYLIITDKKDHKGHLIEINKLEIDALDNKISAFPDGTEYIDPNHPFSLDLDIFGEGSVFQFLNRTITRPGKEKLAYLLSVVNLNPRDIISRQQSVKELSAMLDLRQDFNATGKIAADSDSDLSNLHLWLAEPGIFIQNRIYKFLAFFLPALSLIFLTLTFIDFGFINVLIMILLLQFFVVGIKFKYTNRIHGLIGKRLSMLRKYGKLISFLEDQNYNSPGLNTLKSKLISHSESASKIIQKLARIVSAFDNRLNLLVGFFLNGILLWDIQCMLRLEKWKLSHKNDIPKWLEVLGEYDALLSLSNFYFNNPEFVFPEFSDAVIFKASEIGHPLIPISERVNNSLEIKKEGNFIIITGANMAGKSTFLRTIGANIILGMAGAPVCAASLQFKPMPLFTSMRTNDSLQKHESYFYAELKRLKELIDELKKSNRIFIILDEILKGTNSKDKQLGSQAVLKQIIHRKGTGLIATHDLELAKMEQQFPDKIKNKCFEIEIEGAKIYFDYKLVDGITKKMNASLLMQQMGIIDS
ncbi:MAG: hypothetical protein JXJ22_10415 [Bacteroidales bacterium]|nr:hypothetical protein [Bacteroidales bacterium]